MYEAGRSIAILDASVLINFLKVARIDLLARHPGFRFIVIDAVRSEITEQYPRQVDLLLRALASGALLPDGSPGEIQVEELAILAALADLPLGKGEKAAVAAAKTRALALAMDDERAWKMARHFLVGVPRETTPSLMITLVKYGVLNVQEADAIKADWESAHRFKMSFSSFGDAV